MILCSQTWALLSKKSFGSNSRWKWPEETLQNFTLIEERSCKSLFDTPWAGSVSYWSTAVTTKARLLMSARRKLDSKRKRYFSHSSTLGKNSNFSSTENLPLIAQAEFSASR